MDNNFQAWSLETMKFHITIDQLLKTIQSKIDNLPDNKDFSGISKQLKDVIDDIDKMNSTWTSHAIEFDKIKNTVFELKKNLEIITDDLEEIPIKNKEITENLILILNLVNLFNQEITNAKIRLREEMFTLSDFNEVIILAKRLNNRHNMWSGWKGKTAIIVGSILGIGTLINYFIELIQVIRQLIP